MLFRKIIRDIKNNKMQFISIMLMAFLAVFVYSGIGSLCYTYQTDIDAYYERQNSADIWLYGNNFTEKDTDSLLEVGGITDATRRIHLSGIADYDGDPELDLYLTDDLRISTCEIITGEAFTPESDGVWLSSKFAEARGLRVGDSLKIEVEGYSLSKKILGLMINPESVYACASFDSIGVPKNIGVVYAGTDLLPEAFPKVYNQIAATTSEKDYDALERRVETQMGDDYYVFLSRDVHKSYQEFYNEIQKNKAIADVFPMVFIAIALLTILTTMTRMINNQRTQIGTLKSLGFKDRNIKWHYISYGLISSSAGSLLGLLTGPKLFAPLFIRLKTGMYTLPELKVKLLPNAIGIALLTTLLCTFITYLACQRILKEIPAETLRPKAPKAAKQLWLERTTFWKKTGFDFQWNFRDALRNRVRSLMAIAGVAGCMALLICGLGMIDNLQNINDWKYDELTGYRSKILVDDTLTVSDIPYSGESMQEARVEVRFDGSKKTVGLNVLEADSELLHFVDAQVHPLTLPQNGVSISYKLAGLLSVNIGDTVDWHLYGDSTWISSVVKAIYRDPVQQGLVTYKNYFEEQGFHYQPTVFLTKENIDTESTDYTIWSVDGLKATINDFMDSMYAIVYIMVLAAILMAIAVLYNLGTLSFAEKQREFATLRVLGFKVKKIRSLLFTQNISLCLLGLLPGYYLGNAITNIITSSLGEDFDMMMATTPRSILISIGITLITSIAVNMLFAKKIKNIDMVSALKGVE